MTVTVIIRAELKGDRASMQAPHDSVTGATKEMALLAGDVSHATFLSSTNPRDFLGIDVWASPEAVQRFSADPRIQDFFGQLFDGMPEVTIWDESGRNRW